MREVRLKFDYNFARHILISLFILSVFLISFNKIKDSDAWLHLSMGKLIWQNGGLPHFESYTYPMSGEPFLYSSWLFGLLCYGIYAILGSFGLVLLKATVITTTFYILLRDSLRPFNDYAVTTLIILAAAILSSLRFVLRPDIFFMAFLSYSIFSLNAYLYENRKYIYFLPFVHLIWANMHSSITVMPVPFVSFIAGGFVQRHLEVKGIIFDKTPSNKQLKTVAVIFAASFAATLLNPYFIGQYFFGSEFLSTRWYTQHISELLPPENSMTIYGVSGIILISFFLSRKRFSVIHFLLVIPFLYFAFSASRFLFLIAIIGFPVVARNISASRALRGASSSRNAAVVVAACIIIFGSYFTATAVKDGRFGPGFDYSSMPRRAVEYMDENGIYGRMLNTFHFGQYITWTGYPKREIFTDARGHLPENLLEKLIGFIYSTSVLDELYEAYGPDSILIDYSRPYYYGMETSEPIFAPSSHPRWALVYWDDISLLYLRRGEKYSGLISRDEYTHVKPEMPFSTFMEAPRDEEERVLLIEELKRNIKETDSVRARVFLGYVYYEDGSLDIAHECLSEAISMAPKYADAHYALGVLYLKRGNLDMSEIHLNRYIKLKPSGPLAGKSLELLRKFRKK